MRLWGLVLVPMLVVTTLVACSSHIETVSSRAVGDCWEISAGAAQMQFLNTDQEAIKCAQDALSTTYFTGQISGATDQGYLSEQFLSAQSINELPESMYQVILNSCQESLIANSTNGSSFTQLDCEGST